MKKGLIFVIIYFIIMSLIHISLLIGLLIVFEAIILPTSSTLNYICSFAAIGSFAIKLNSLFDSIKIKKVAKEEKEE